MPTSRYWRPYSLRSRLVRFLLPDLDFTLRPDGELQLRASLQKHLGLFLSNALRREANVARILAGHVGQGNAIYDVGANIGLYTLVFAQHQRRRVVSFEPAAIALRYLRRNVELNGLTNVDIQPIVLSDRPGTLRFAVDRVTTATSHVCEDGEPGTDHPCSDLDSLIEEKRLPAPALIKLDVEGHEEPILRGMARTLARYRPQVFLEGGRRDAAGEVCAMHQLAAAGYRIYDLTRQRTLAPDTPAYEFLAVPA